VTKQANLGYGRRLARVARAGAVRRLGGLWALWLLVVPTAAGALGAALDGLTTGAVSVFAGLLIALAAVIGFSLARSPMELDAEVRAERDDALNALAQAAAARRSRSEVESGLHEFAERLREGNELERRLRRPPTTAVKPAERNTQRAAIRAEFQTALRGWKDNCRGTIAAYLPHRAPFFEKAFDTTPRRATTFVSDFHHELLVKLERMETLQSEFASAAREVVQR
jgi:hypothetical protein